MFAPAPRDGPEAPERVAPGDEGAFVARTAGDVGTVASSFASMSVSKAGVELESVAEWESPVLLRMMGARSVRGIGPSFALPPALTEPVLHRGRPARSMVRPSNGVTSPRNRLNPLQPTPFPPCTHARSDRWGVGAVLALVLALTTLTSCASYPQRTEAAFRAFQSGQLPSAMEAYADPKTTGSEFLTAAETGMVALAAGDWDAAIRYLSAAADVSKSYEDAALINPESAGETLLSWTINESMTSYQGEGFERVMIHACLAIAYLGKGDVTAAGVEVRRANALLESEEKLYKKSYKAGGLGHMLSAIAYELDRKDADAYIDYQRMLDKGVGEALAGRALVRLSNKLSRSEDAEAFVSRFGPDDERPANAANVVIVAGVGIGPFKREITLPIPTSDGLLQWSVPEFVRRPQPISHLEFEVVGGDRTVSTVVVEDAAAVAIENLSDRIVWLSAKSAVRALLKYQLTKQLEKDHGAIGTLAGIVFTLVTEHADLRAWQTLPDTWQAARVFLAPGEHQLRLRSDGGNAVDLGRFELAAGETMFVFARTIENRLFAHPVGGRRLDVPPTPPTPGESAVQTPAPEGTRP